MRKILIILFLIPPYLYSSCFPVLFDHFYFRVDDITYEKLGKNTSLGKNNLSLFEPNKRPTNSYYGHYISGNLSYIEVFNHQMDYTPESLGIGFLIEKVGCLQKIHEKLNNINNSNFKLQKEAAWGNFTDSKKKELRVWISELKPDYVGKGKDITRKAYQRKSKEETLRAEPPDYKLNEIIFVDWELNRKNLKYLSAILISLGWKKIKQNKFKASNTVINLSFSKNKKSKLKKVIFDLNATIKNTPKDAGSLKFKSSRNRFSIINNH